ncbi:DNA-binding IclR family transcriptional regulator [Spinactinospora alkalitolerans]|uniref:DNA-binding IclR family transcriptional regulator n=1 Tax=Spinactinospora alkalitolerans TaxID=687207 RepID=A0A852TYC4_9ACTN|nr:IclR family transcriptional regulator [Spinactinospora alkalitolerans]NYE47803.1 DNA-binding IclR family transcriptional regulator [Spinactinospora alkalitolerans]
MPSSLERALRILVELASGPATISELGRRLGVHRTTSLRLLRTLEEERFVRRTEDGRYRIGPRMATLAHAALEGVDLRAAATGHLRALGAACGHTVHLAALEGDSVVYLDKVESRHAVRMYSRIGASAPLHATGVGKAILAHLSEEERDELLGPPPFGRCTPNTRTTRTELDEDLAAVAERGWALDDFEHEEFIQCVAAPIRDASGRVSAAVSVSAPGMVLDRAGLLALAPDLTATAGAISEEIGWSARA